MVYYKSGKIADAYNSTMLALEIMPQDWNAVYHHARYSAKMNYIEEFKRHLVKCIINDQNYLLAADNDIELFDVRKSINEIALYLRDEKSRKVKKLIDKLVIIRKRAEELGVTDFSSINEAIKDTTDLYKLNNYFDLLKAEKLSIGAFDYNLKNWITIKNTYIAGLNNEKNSLLYFKIEGLGCMCSILGFLIYVVVISFRGATINWVIHPSLVIIIGIAMAILLYKLLPKIIKTIKINAIEKKIFEEKDTLERLESLRYEINPEMSG